jgi:hypothetical protein
MAATTGAEAAAGTELLALSLGGKGAQALRRTIDAATRTPGTLKWVLKVTLLLSVSK